MRHRGRALAPSLLSFAVLAGACESNSPRPGDASGGSPSEAVGGTGALGGAAGGGAGIGGAGIGGASGSGGFAGGAGLAGVGGTSGSASGGVTSGAAGASAGTSAGTGASPSAGEGGAPVAGSSGAAGTSGSSAGTSEGGEGGADDPSDRVVLFDGESLAEWRPLDGDGEAEWELPGDGTMVVAPGRGNIVSRLTFEDVFVHVEYKTPELPSTVTGQDRGNSGVYLNSMYELQVLDSFGLPPAINGCGAIYGVSAPSSSACEGQEIWNTYEIEFQAARFDDQNQKLEAARVISAHLNGVLVQEDVAVPNSTEGGAAETPGPGPLMLQDHGNRVSFRNIWVVPRSGNR